MHNTICPHCGDMFVYEGQPEIAMGACACPLCGGPVTQADVVETRVSPLVRRVIGEAAERETRTYHITSRPDHLDQIEQFFAWMNSTRSGHSGSAEMAIDGDGAARVEIERKDGELKKPDEEVQPRSGRGPEYKVCLESADKTVPKPVVVRQRQVEYDECPHCGVEIYEKHIYEDEKGTAFHRDCGGAIIPKPFDWATIDPKWRALLEPKKD